MTAKNKISVTNNGGSEQLISHRKIPLYDLVVIGGGPAGMLAAIEAGRAGLSVLILEHNDTYGKKLSITGNGRCNYTNLYQAPECYRGSDPVASFDIIKNFPPDQIIRFMRTLGIEPHERSGREFNTLTHDNGSAPKYIYPASESAVDFFNAFMVEMAACKVKIKTRVHAIGVRRVFDTDCGEYIEVVTAPAGEATDTFPYKTRVVLAAPGGMAAPETGSDGSFFDVTGKLGIKTAQLAPALTKIYVEEDLSELAGVRITGHISLVSDRAGDRERIQADDIGEIQFARDAVSGIPAMQISSFVSERGQVLILDFLPQKDDNEAIQYFRDRRTILASHPAVSFLTGLFPVRFAEMVIKKLQLPRGIHVSELSDNDIKRMTSLIKNMHLRVNRSGTYSESQVTKGGILLSECNQELEAKSFPGLYFAGEILDTDGICGGYNLTWAFASAHTAVKDIIRKFNGK